MYDSCMARMPTTSATTSRKQSTSRQGSLTELFESITPYEQNLKRHAEITLAITEFIAKDMMPIGVVTNPGFTALVNTESCSRAENSGVFCNNN